jgi:hypothetical protein
MRRKLLPSAIALAPLVLVACPPPTFLTVINDTGRVIEVCHRRCKSIAAGGEVEFRISRGPWSFTIREGIGKSYYSFEALSIWDHAWHSETSECEICPQFVVQVEPTLVLYLVSSSDGRAHGRLPPQPKGFPLLPRGSESAAQRAVAADPRQRG